MQNIRRQDRIIGQMNDTGSHIYYYDLRGSIVAIYDKGIDKTRPTSGGLDEGNTGLCYVPVV